MKKKKVFGLLLSLALILSVALPGTLATSANAESMDAGSAVPAQTKSFYERAMACASGQELETVLDGVTDQELAALTEAELEAIEARIDLLESEPLSAVETEEPSDEPVQSEIVYPTVSYTDAAPFGSPVAGGEN